ncbi:MAG: GH74 [uncultured Thermoleophilia bacterium]|uniref:GH74 n=1 Tax=uncultured Thermoleophilia bacterium TaxID=1497501 RepID=A0A6J4TKF0_9ACTN|nr:MAG: GH74 [uncultured Thermoleophilia bacterium]
MTFSAFDKRSAKRSARRCASRLATFGAAAVLAACAGGDEETTPQAEGTRISDAGPQHVHGLGINPADDSLLIATHSGLWRAPADQRKAERVADVRHDLMGFTVVGPDRFLASGHPDARTDLPPQLGLQRSIDGGRSWDAISLLGEADLHVLRAAGERVYGVDSGTGAFLTSADGGQAWQQRTPPAPVFDLAIDPDDADAVVAATERGLFGSTDTGRTWRPLGDTTGLLAWPADHRFFLVEGDGQVSRSSDAGRTFERTGRIGGLPEAFAANGERELYAALHGGEVLMSADGGANWRTRSTP